MKAENTDTAPGFNLLKPEGLKPQADGKQIKAVLLDDGQWYEVVPGSFKLYQSAAKAPSFGPYVTFDIADTEPNTPGPLRNPLAGMTIEVFPATVKGWAI